MPRIRISDYISDADIWIISDKYRNRFGTIGENNVMYFAWEIIKLIEKRIAGEEENEPS